ncbi:MAG: hypothetical protein ACRDRJ_11465 [Streptosporangiaceae bacterium]
MSTRAPKYVPKVSGVIRICRVQPVVRSAAMTAALDTSAAIPRVIMAAMK